MTVPEGSSGSVAVVGDAAETDEPVDRVERAVLAVDGVVRLGGQGPFGVATYLPGRQVSGVALRDDEVVVHVVARYGGRPLPVVAADVRAAVAGALDDARPVSVVVEDVEVGGDDGADGDQPAAGSAAAPPGPADDGAQDAAPRRGRRRGSARDADDTSGATPPARAPRRRAGAPPAPDVAP